ncbi:MAG: Maf family nucleotide pyrophosphatase [Bacteroidales bacterium]|nr:Maf family nucleotide pyrophosphatase [Bacteroidales bacterium]MCF8402408.1 Maf family nucleotide pyrophosphatase [Bacteroidales bacterium]
MLQDILQDYQIILASGSPRRQQLLKELGINFAVRVLDVEEIYPENLTGKKIAKYLAELKSIAFDLNELSEKSIIITADTVVWQNGEVLPKPNDRKHAINVLQKLSGNSHEVITGVCLRNSERLVSFTSSTKVWFKALSEEEIDFYITNYQPYDKAGAYGIQEWIGYIGIEKIEGSYYNVMGLPIQMLYSELINFVK